MQMTRTFSHATSKEPCEKTRPFWYKESVERKAGLIQECGIDFQKRAQNNDPDHEADLPTRKRKERTKHAKQYAL